MVLDRGRLTIPRFCFGLEVLAVVPTIRPALTFHYAIAGRTLCIEAADEWSATVASRFCRDFYLAPISGNAILSSPYTIRIFSEANPPSVPEGLNSFEVAFGQCHTDGERSYLTVEDSVITTGIGESRDSLSVWIGKLFTLASLYRCLI